LFKNLVEFTHDREASKNIWGLTRIPEIIRSLPNLEFDENGEPTLGSLNKAINIAEYLIDTETSL